MTDLTIASAPADIVAPVSGHSLADRLGALAGIDRGLILTGISLSLAPLALGLGFGFLTALLRGGLSGFEAETAYRILTAHGTSAFFWWLYVAQVALMLGLAAGESPDGLKGRPLILTGLVALVLGIVVSEATIGTRTPLLYDASPELGLEDPLAVAGMACGYLLLALGLILTSLAAIATVLRSSERELSAMGFGVLAWAGFLIVSGLAAVNAFLPNFLWGLGVGPFPAKAATDWHILFHNLHYLPLMATVLMWYALTKSITGVASAFGERFSKIVFAAYLVFVPPTSLYHMFLEPDLDEGVRVAGTLLSLFVSVPTLIAFLIIVSSLELATRAKVGTSGLFGWIGHLPWRNPAFAAMGEAIVATLIGIVFAFVLIQEKFAPMISDTLFVPGYFHFFAVGAVSETFIAGLLLFITILRRRAIWRPGLMAALPWVILFGLVLFGAGGMIAGIEGVPRRTMDVSYGGDAPASWHWLMLLFAVGGTIFAIALAVQVFGVLRTLIGRSGTAAPVAAATAPGPVPGSAAWTGPIAIVLVVAAMSVATIATFDVMRALPIVAVGGHSGH
ncbi:MAG: cbb3-type cytochrome c oxidase subunit I [Ancalomicrobiaceae bacterium]|nr:cbb3-type cytochrome c oxidase subunit I [Ancalomicrobiaceae bacterium]